jgi:hypothetical protein
MVKRTISSWVDTEEEQQKFYLRMKAIWDNSKHSILQTNWVSKLIYDERFSSMDFRTNFQADKMNGNEIDLVTLYGKNIKSYWNKKFVNKKLYGSSVISHLTVQISPMICWQNIVQFPIYSLKTSQE